jgi:hypothetical protein
LLVVIKPFLLISTMGQYPPNAKQTYEESGLGEMRRVEGHDGSRNQCE